MQKITYLLVATSIISWVLGAIIELVRYGVITETGGMSPGLF